MSEYTTPKSGSGTETDPITVRSGRSTVSPLGTSDIIGSDTPTPSREHRKQNVSIKTGLKQMDQEKTRVLDWFMKSGSGDYTWYSHTAPLIKNDVQVTYHLMFTKGVNGMLVQWYVNKDIYEALKKNEPDALETEGPEEDACLVEMRAAWDGTKFTTLSIENFFYFTNKKYVDACPWAATHGESELQITHTMDNNSIVACRKDFFPDGVPPPLLSDCFPLYFAGDLPSDHTKDKHISELQSCDSYGLATKFGFAAVHIVLKLLMPTKSIRERMETVSYADVWNGSIQLKTHIDTKMLQTETLASIYLKELIGQKASNAWKDYWQDQHTISDAIAHVKNVGYYWGIKAIKKPDRLRKQLQYSSNPGPASREAGPVTVGVPNRPVVHISFSDEDDSQQSGDSDEDDSLPVATASARPRVGVAEESDAKRIRSAGRFIDYR